MTRALLRNSSLSLAIAMALSMPIVHAQDGDATEQAQTEATELDAVQVTARRRSESIQDVPVAVSAFGEEALKDLQASNIDGLQGAVPNMNIVQGRGSSNSVNVFIRGIGQPDALQTFDPGVGMYVDDVYYSRVNGALFSLFDVQQVEVLRGPQGTLYGKNSTGGAIKINTKNPFDDAGGAAELTAGNFGRLEGRWYVGAPLSDRFAMSLAGAWIQSDGYVEDPVTGEKYNGEKAQSLRGKLAFRPSDTVHATLSLDYTHQDSPLTLGQPTAPLIRTNLVPTAIVPLLVPSADEYDFESRTSFAPDQGQEMTHKGASLNVSWDINTAWTLNRRVCCWIRRGATAPRNWTRWRPSWIRPRRGCASISACWKRRWKTWPRASA